MHRFIFEATKMEITVETTEEFTHEIVESFYRYMLGCGHAPENVANAMYNIAEEQFPSEDDKE